ncbi:MAG: C39 family peptidase [Patescibacteria group bacterium]|jgi:hypothetical protein
MKRLICLFFCLFLLVLTGCDSERSVNISDFNNNTAVKVDEQPRPVLTEIKDSVKEAVDDGIEMVEEKVADFNTDEKEIGLPEIFDQKMAFSRQAPFGNWDTVHEEACEEASLIMVNNFFQKKPLDEKIMDQEINKLLPWEKERFGFVESTTIEETAIMAREYFGLKTEVVVDVTVDRIKKELIAGRLIVLPLAGQELHNPNYTGAGPLYHMLVVRGYDRDQFITNDPGTRKGGGYKYKYDVLLNAVHDWNGGDVLNGKKAMLLIQFE